VDVGARSLSVSDLLSIYRTMLTVRLAEERFMRGLSRGEFPGFYFPVHGMEAAEPHAVETGDGELVLADGGD